MKRSRSNRRPTKLGLSIVVSAITATLLVPGAHAETSASYPLVVENNCSDPIYVRGHAESGTLQPDNQLLAASNGSATYTLSADFVSGNLFGCWDNTVKKGISVTDTLAMEMHCAMAEVSVTDVSTGAVNADITFVDAISLAASVSLDGGQACNPASCSIGTSFTSSAITSGCPTQVVDGEVCLSANTYCTQNPTASFCSQLDQAISDCVSQQPACADAQGSTTTDVYGCSGSFFSTAEGEPFCAALNRGFLSQCNQGCTNQTNSADFYPSGGTFNTYAAFVHQTAGAFYAFPYDDYPGSLNQAGDLGATGSSQLTVTFCPSSESGGATSR
ncbi:MAG: beta-1,3-glucanase family protein [Acidobacteriota bacterium]